MTVSVELLGPMRRPWRERQRDVEVTGGTVGELLTELGYRHAEVRFFSVLVNGARARTSDALVDGDRVTVALVVGGG